MELNRPYKILSVQPEELEACLETVHSAFLASCRKYGFTKENYPKSGAFLSLEELQQAKMNGVHMYAAWVDGRAAGYVQLEKKENGVYSFQKFAVLPEYQNLGIGKALIRFCCNKAAVYGGKKLRLLMVYENRQLLDFYTANGFRLVETGRDAEHPFEYGIMEMDL